MPDDRGILTERSDNVGTLYPERPDHIPDLYLPGNAFIFPDGPCYRIGGAILHHKNTNTPRFLMVFCLIKDNVFDSPVLCTPPIEPIGRRIVDRHPARTGAVSLQRILWHPHRGGIFDALRRIVWYGLGGEVQAAASSGRRGELRRRQADIRVGAGLVAAEETAHPVRKTRHRQDLECACPRERYELGGRGTERLRSANESGPR